MPTLTCENRSIKMDVEKWRFLKDYEKPDKRFGDQWAYLDPNIGEESALQWIPTQMLGDKCLSEIRKTGGLTPTAYRRPLTHKDACND